MKPEWLRILLISVAIRCSTARKSTKEYPSYNGWNNNRANPSWGSPDNALTRTLPPHYQDGVYSASGWNRPNAREVSNALAKGTSGIRSFDNKTALFVFYGQHVLNEIVDTEHEGCPPEAMNIKVPRADPLFDPKGFGNVMIPYKRSRYDTSNSGYSPNSPRNQLNAATSFLDGSSIYGHGRVWADSLRRRNRNCPSQQDCRGELRASDEKINFPTLNSFGLPIHNPAVPKSHQLKPPGRFFATGSRLNNENPFLLSIGVIWFRHHNWLARVVRSLNVDWSDEQVFQEARVRNVATYQKITYYDWLPILLGELSPPYYGYKASTSVGISNVFQSAAMRYLYTMLPPGVKVRNDTKGYRNCQFGDPVRLCNSYWRSEEIIKEKKLENIVLGMASQMAEAEDNVITEDVRDFYHGPLEFSRRDLVSLSIQTGRDHGLPDYNTAREQFGLNRTTFENLPDSLKQSLDGMHDSSPHYDNVDIVTGGLLENVDSPNPSDLFHIILRNQFQALRDGDRFWFENYKNGHVDSDTMKDIQNTTFRDVLLRVLKGTTKIPSKLFQWDTELKCSDEMLSSETMTEKCIPLATIDYFASSKVSFAVTFAVLGLICLVAVFIMLLIVKYFKRKKNIIKLSKTSEWVAKELISLKPREKWLKVQITLNDGGKMSVNLRSIDLTRQAGLLLCVSDTGKRRHALLRTTKDSYDLTLKFPTRERCKVFCDRFASYCRDNQINVQTKWLSRYDLLKEARTKEGVQSQIMDFIKNVVSFGVSTVDELPESIRNFEFTRNDLANCFGVRAESSFLSRIFEGGHKQHALSCSDLMPVLVLLSEGKGEEKSRTLFNLYDQGKSGFLRQFPFVEMIRSLSSLTGGYIMGDADIDKVVKDMIEAAGINLSIPIEFEDFQRFMKHHEIQLDDTKLQETETQMLCINGKYPPRRDFFTVERIHRVHKTRLEKWWKFFVKMVGHYKLHIFWLSLYCCITAGVFAYVFNAVSSNMASGLLNMAGYPLLFAKASAGALMFNFSTLLLTVCWNTITFLRETFVRHYVPFDAAITMHKIIAWMGLFFSVVHVVAHGINFFSISTQSPMDLLCYFSDIWWPSNFLPTFFFWGFQTITGITGIVLCVVLLIMYLFACDYARHVVYRIFHWTHVCGILLFYIFMLLHGGCMLVSEPGFHLYFLGPAILYTLDKIYSLSRRRTEYLIECAKLLPSEVLHLTIRRPQNFHYLAGQWLLLACPEIVPHEYHPFTISSAPNESTIQLHIKEAGPWTRKLRKLCRQETLDCNSYPKLYIDGPFGEGHQDWYKHQVAVLIGSGIGVTPFSSILKDLIHKSTTGSGIICKKVYFLWSTRNQGDYEWLIDIIRNVEDDDKLGILETHVFITKHKYYFDGVETFDLKTTMMYACERQFHKVEGRSLFTGLKATTHFGRPNFKEFLENVQNSREHRGVKKIGVFTCGKPTVAESIEAACKSLNLRRGPLFAHTASEF